MAQVILTNLGRQAAIDSFGGGNKIKISYFKVGSQIINPQPTLTGVAGEVYSSKNTSNTINYEVYGNDQVTYFCTLDETVGDFLVGNIGIYLENDTLFAIMSLPSQEQKNRTLGYQTGNKKTYKISITLSNQVGLSDFNLLTTNYTNLPTVESENLLPAVSPVPLQKTYYVRNHSRYMSPVLAQFVDNTWKFTKLFTDYNGSGEYTWLDRINNITLASSDIKKVCVYDTKLDYGNGKWKDSLSNLSWYSESLSSTFQSVRVRGSQKGFPYLVGIVATSTSIYLYDLTTPAVPLWMAITKDNNGNGVIKEGHTITSIDMSEGVLTVGLTNNTSGQQGYVLVIDFVTDVIRAHDNISCSITNVNIADRHSSTLIWQRITGGALPNSQINDVTISYTGITGTYNLYSRPSVIIGVAHDLGISLIKSTTSVLNSTDNAKISAINIVESKVIYSRFNSSSLLMLNSIPASTDFSADVAFSETSATSIAPSSISGNSSTKINKNIILFSKPNLLSRIYLNETQNMSNITTSTHTTGWMPNNTVACWLANGITQDRHYNNNAFVQTGSLSISPAIAGSDMQMVSSFNTNIYLAAPHSTSFDFGTESWAISMWVRLNGTASQKTLFEQSYYTSVYGGSAIRIYTDSNMVPKVTLTNNGFSSSFTLVANRGLVLNELVALVVQREGSKMMIYINGELSASATITTATGSLTNNNSIIRLGVQQDGLNPATDMSMALVRVVKGAYITLDNIRKMYNDEKILFYPYTKYLLEPNTVINEVSFDPCDNRQYIATSKGTLCYEGLSRIASINSTTRTTITSDMHISASINGGVQLIASSSEASSYKQENNLSDFINLALTGPLNSLAFAQANASLSISGNSPILATGTTFARSLSDRFSDGQSTFNVLDFEGIDPTGVNDCRTAIQAALNKGITKPVTVIIPSGSYLIGSNGGVDTEQALTIYSGTTLIIQGELKHNINPSHGALIVTPNQTETPGGATSSNIHVILQGASKITYMPRTLTNNRKGISLGNVLNFSVQGVQTEGNDIGSFNTIIFNASRGIITGMNIRSGNGDSEEGVRLSGNISSVIIDRNIITSGDSALCIAQDSSAFSSCTISNILISNNILKSTGGFPTIKLLTNSSATNSVIKDISFTNNNISRANGGQLLTINNSVSTGSTISDIKFRCTTGGDMLGGSTTEPGIDIYGATNIDLGDMPVVNTTNKGIFIQSCNKINVGPNATIGGYSGQSSVLNTLTISSAAYISAGIMEFTFTGTPNLSSINASTDYVVTSGFANGINNGRFNITSADNTAKTIRVVSPISRTSAQDETTMSVTASIVRRGDSNHAIDIKGSVGVIIKDSYITNPGAHSINIQQGTDGVVPNFIEISGNKFAGCLQDSIINISSMKNSRVCNNTAEDCNAIYFVNDSGSSDNTNNNIHNNTDCGITTCKHSYKFISPTNRTEHNIGSNSDFISGSIVVASGSTSSTINLPASVYAMASSSALTSGDIEFRPTTGWGGNNLWETGTVYAAGARITHGCLLYTTTAGGTSGSTAPTHTSGSASDGGVTWAYAGIAPTNCIGWWHNISGTTVTINTNKDPGWGVINTWQATTVYSGDSIVANGNYLYTTTAGGTSGSTAPTHTSGSASDGGVTWVYLGINGMAFNYAVSPNKQ